MKHACTLLIAAMTFGTIGCIKDDNDLTPDPPIDVCGLDGARMKADVEGTAGCFSAGIFGALADGQLAIGGNTLDGMSLAFQLDSLTIGTHAATEDANHVLLIVSGVGYQSTNETPGAVTISSHDSGNNRIKGTFTAHVAAPEGGPTKNVSGEFDITYTEQ